MTKALEISEATGHLEELIASLTQDDEIILTINQKPVARLTRIPQVEDQPEQAHGGERIVGLERGKIWISDDFDDPLPDEFCWARNEV